MSIVFLVGLQRRNSFEERIFPTFASPFRVPLESNGIQNGDAVVGYRYPTRSPATDIATRSPDSHEKSVEALILFDGDIKMSIVFLVGLQRRNSFGEKILLTLLPCRSLGRLCDIQI